MSANDAPVTPEVFIPHGQECEADHGNGPDFGRCGEPACAVVVVADGRERYVCYHHKALWNKGRKELN